MRVTEVKIFPVKDEKLKAFVSVVFDGCFMVNDVKIIEGREGRFISMPSRRKRNGRFKDIAHPLNSDTRAMLEREILMEYERVAGGGAADEPEGSREAEPEPAPEPRERDASPAREAEAPASPAGDDGGIADDGASDGTLEEVTEKHLSDTFWTS